MTFTHGKLSHLQFGDHVITASNEGDALTLVAGPITASTQARTLSGLAIRYGVPGRTSAGLLKVAPGALTFPEDLTEVKLIREHDLSSSRGYLVSLTENATGIRASLRASDGPDGDDALREAKDKTRNGFSFHVVDPVIQGDTIVAGLVVAIGQVGIPAYSETRIDQIAASQTPATTTGENMTPEQRARLAALRAQATRTAEEEAELNSLAATAYLEDVPDTAPAAAPEVVPAAAAPEPVTAAMLPAIPQGVPSVGPARIEVAEPSQLDKFFNVITAALGGDRSASITAALNDITDTEHSADVTSEDFIGQLWSGLVYQRQFVPLLNTGSLTKRKGRGWKWVVKPEVSDYAGDKAEIPSNNPTTEDASWTAARLAGGHDIDRSYYDFKDEEFLRAYFAAMVESYALKSDLKALDFINAAATVPVGVDSQTNLLKAAAIAGVYAKRATNGQPATSYLVNDLDLLSLFDTTAFNVSAYLDLWNIDPSKFVSSDRVAAGHVTAVVKQAATFRELPGSPIRVSAQHIANGGVDEALFGYWAVEEHHEAAFVKVPFAEAP